VVHDGELAWVAYEFEDGSDTGIAVNAIIEDPDPLSPRVLVATTDFDQERDVEIHYEANHLWVSWIDSASEVGWSEYDYQAQDWSTTDYESYASDTVRDARDRIEDEVLGN
jgi:hypothetical protein